MSIYLEIDSTYRNRNLWPIPGEFEIPISQTGTKDKKDALDPVCLSEPLVSWSVTALASNLALCGQLTGVIANGSIGASNIGASTNNLDFIIDIGVGDARALIPQQIENYMVGLVLQNIQTIVTPIVGRIASYKYLGTTGTGLFPNYYSSRCLITVDAALSGWNYGDVIRIVDPSDYKIPSYPLFFIPNGANQDNAYSNYILYNENTNDYRSITLYDAGQAIVSTKPWLVVWPFNSTYNFCIRKIPPVFPLQLENNLIAEASSTNYRVTALASGSTYVTVGQNSTSSVTIITSSDGILWSPSINNPFVGGAGNGVTYVNYINKWVAVGKNGTGTVTVAISNDSLNWITAPVDNAFPHGQGNGVAFTNIGIIIAVGSDTGGNQIKRSGDGITWKNVLTFPFINGFGNGVANGVVSGVGYFVAVGINGGFTTNFAYCFTATFTVWTAIIGLFFNNTTVGGRGVVWVEFANKWVAVGGSTGLVGQIYYSTGAPTAWTLVNDPLIFTNGVGNAVAHNGTNLIVAVGNNAANTITIATSPDGINWTAASTPNPFGVGGVGKGITWTGKGWIAVGTNAANTETIAESTDGQTWTVISNPLISGFGNGVAVFNSPIKTYSLSQVKDYYKNYFIRLRPYRTGVALNNTGIYTSTIVSQSRRITSYTYDSSLLRYIFTVYPAFTQIDFTNQTYTIEIEEFSYDNFNPFTYIGTLVEQASCYEFELINLILPNYTLSSGNGSKIAFYPFVYVILSNVSASSSHLRNILYSNNPNAVKVIFRVPISDVQDPETTPFIRLVSSNITQVMKFKPDDNLYFSVLLPNGDIFNTLLPEYYSPAVPNTQSQISALFRYKRI